MTTSVQKEVNNTIKTFTLLQSSFMVLITLIVSIGGWYLIGENYFWNGLDMKRVNQQLDYYKQQVKIDPKNPEFRINLGYTYFLKGDNKKAITEFNQAKELKKDYYDAFYNLGLVYLDEERYDEALENFDKCRQIAPREHKAHVQKGIVYRDMKMYSEAAKEFETANDLLPKNADIIYQIGLLAEAEGKKKAAQEIYKEALSYDPLYKDALKALERVKD